MIRTLKWIYNLGAKHERAKIEAEFDKHKYAMPHKDDSVYDEELSSSSKFRFGQVRVYEKDLDVWHAVEEEIMKRLHPETYVDFEELMKKF